MTNEKLYTKPTEEEYDEVKELTKTNKKILKYSILTIIMILVTMYLRYVNTSFYNN